MAIVEAALTVALPVSALSILADSWYYGRLTVAPYNFVYINVVDNLSKFFGEAIGAYYLQQLPDFICVLSPYSKLVLFGFCLFTMYQVNGMLLIQRTQKYSNAPCFLIFFASNLLVLSNVDHKEQRFMAQLFPLFGLFYAFFWEVTFDWVRCFDKIAADKGFKLPMSLLNMSKLLFACLNVVYGISEVIVLLVN